MDASVKILPTCITEYETVPPNNPIFEARTRGVGYSSLEHALEWGISGPVLRGSGLEWDLRKKMPTPAMKPLT